MIYLDANATTPLHPAARDAMLPLLGATFGNPSSVHAAGQAARAAIDHAREQCATAIGARPKDLIFTSGGTEAAQLAITGAVRGLLAKALAEGLQPKVITSAVEHPCVHGACEELEPLGVATVRIGVDARGQLDLRALADALAEPGALLCSVMAANNETGALSPLEEIGALCRRYQVLLHTDAVQLAGKARLRVGNEPGALPADLISLSGHKLEGPKGIGLVWARTGITLRAMQPGGHQERGRRGGTENAAAIAGLGAAVEQVSHDFDARIDHLARLHGQLEAAIRKIPQTKIVADGAARVGNTVCALFEGCDAQTLLVGLDQAGICVSTGSACSSGSLSPSPVLLAMGFSADEARSALRFSLWRGNTEQEITHVAELLPHIVARSRDS